MKTMNTGEKVKLFLIRNAVPIVFLVVSAIAIPISHFSIEYLVQEMLIRLSRNAFLVLSLLIPIMAGKYLVGDAQIGEYFRVFVSYGIISLALVLHAWRRHADKVRARAELRGDAAGA